MADVILGNELAQYKEELRDQLPDNILRQIDEEGINIIASYMNMGKVYWVNCLMKLKDMELPREVYLLLTPELWDQLVYENFDPSYTEEVH